MRESPVSTDKTDTTPAPEKVDHLRFHRAHAHLEPTFGSDKFALRAEAFARFFGTPTFLGAQTLIVLIWICLNLFGVTHFDIYPFILLNLAFSLQAAYAAPLILLAQTRRISMLVYGSSGGGVRLAVACGTLVFFALIVHSLWVR